MRTAAIFLFLLVSTLSNCQTDSISDEFLKVFKSAGLDKKYLISKSLKPAFLNVDLNADSVTDIALFVAEKKSNRKGIIIIHGQTQNFYVFGAGKDFGNGGDDFQWADQWSIFKDKPAQETQVNSQSGDLIESKSLKLNKPALLIEALEDGTPSSGGLIYWNGSSYIWIQQGE